MEDNYSKFKRFVESLENTRAKANIKLAIDCFEQQQREKNI
jgi:hypothetical protein